MKRPSGQSAKLAIFTGYDHTNAFGVRHKGIDITNSPSTRYNGDRFSTQYGYRMIEVDENDISVYTTCVVHWYDIFDLKYALVEMKSGDDYGFKTTLDIALKGVFQRIITFSYTIFGELITGNKVAYGN